MAQSVAVFRLFFFIGLLFIVQSLNSNCPDFKNDKCSEFQGKIDEGSRKWLDVYDTNNYTGYLTKETCMEYCSWEEGCEFWSYGISNDQKSAICYMYNSSACDSFTLKGENTLPFVSESKNDAWSFVSGALCVSKMIKVSVLGDPHFTGADNSHFDFTGEPGHNYCLLSDAHIHINAFYGGRFDQWGNNPHKALTWIRQVGILWGHHTIALFAREGSEWEYKQGYMQRVEVDGERVMLSQEGDSADFFNSKLRIMWVSAKQRSGDDLVDVYLVKIEDVIELKLTVRPEIASLRTVDDGIVHFSVEIAQITLSSKVHGVLGQTYRPDHSGRFEKQLLVHDNSLNLDVVPGDNAEGFLDGNPKDYISSSLLAFDCGVNRFSRLEKMDKETTQAMEFSKGTASSSFSRKLLNLH